MNSNLYQKLRAKGWSKADINKAANIINKAEKPKKIQLLDEVIYWFILVIAIIGNIVISIALVPFLIALKSSFLYLVIILMAITFGFLFDSLIRDIESLLRNYPTTTVMWMMERRVGKVSMLIPPLLDRILSIRGTSRFS